VTFGLSRLRQAERQSYLQVGQRGTGLPPKSFLSLLVSLTFIFFQVLIRNYHGNFCSFRRRFDRRPQHAAEELSGKIACKHQWYCVPADAAEEPCQDDNQNR